MKRPTKFVLAAGIAALSIGGITAAGLTAANARGGHFVAPSAAHGGPEAMRGTMQQDVHQEASSRRGHHRGAARGMRLFDAFDANEDGILTQAEVDGVRKERLGKFDANSDGSLDLREYEALWLDAMRERMVRAFQRHDADGDAKVTLDEFSKRTGRIVQRLDTDGDGQASLTELRNRHRDRKDD